MKALLLVFTVFLYACESTQLDTSLKSLEVNTDNADIEQVRRKYPVGDVDNDKIPDRATVIFERDNSIDEIVCDQKNCAIKITFGKNIPDLNIDQSLGIIVQATEDLNKDKANEILVFSRTYQGLWNNISVWTFKNQKWQEIAKTKAIISEDKDFLNRVIQENGRYYLIDDDWNTDSVIERTEIVRL
jgi:hypothetical protein